jgi:tRNA-dihydrouridine synthase
MVMDNAIVYNNNNEQLADYIGFNNEVEPPLVLQLGGNNPERLGEAVSIAERYGQFQEINLNNGCPSNKAKRAGFGAELMLEPDLVRQILYNMKRRSSRSEVTVKCRIGIQGKKESWDDLISYIEAVKAAGCRKVIVHSRVCVLSGLTPAQNRTIPPLRYDAVYRLVDQYPELQFVLNGGVKGLHEVDCHMRGMGVQQHQHQHQQNYNHSNCKQLDKSATVDPDYDQLSRPSVSSVGRQCIPLWSVSLAGRLKIAHAATAGGTADGTTGSTIFRDSVGAVVRGGYYYRCHASSSLLADSTDSTAEGGAGNSKDITITVQQRESSDLNYGMCVLSHDLYKEEGGAGLAGVMIGREAYNNPWSLADADRHFFNKQNPSLSRREALQNYCDHTRVAQDHDHAKNSAAVLCKPLHNFFHGCSTNKLFKQKFDDLIKRKTEKKQSKTATRTLKVSCRPRCCSVQHW